MLMNWISRSACWIEDARRVALVHMHGFCADPRAYLMATGWWLLGKRVRARGQLAPLLSRSPHAYQLWVLRHEQVRQSNSPKGQAPPIIALIIAGTDAANTATQASVAAEGLQAIVVTKAEAGGLGAALTSIDWASDPWLMPMQAGDVLAPGAATAYRAAMAETGAAVLYADDDLLDTRQKRTCAHFKPDWNSELFGHFDYLTGACVLRTGLAALEAVATNDDWPGQLVAQAVATGGACHVRAMLHHRATRPLPPPQAAPLAIAAVLPPLTVIVPTRNRLDLLRTCLAGVAATNYPDVELIIVDNDSDDPATLAFLAAQDPARVQVLRHPGPFNYSVLNNRAVVQARGRLLCLLNNDVEIVAPDWLAIMATQAMRADVGAVGAQLRYPDGRIQHAGVVIGVGNAAGHAHRFIAPDDTGYFRRHVLPQHVSAVTGACLVVERDKFLAVGGLDEGNFAVAFNDVDLCLRLGRRGWQSLYEPRAVLIHHESVSRGHDRDPAGAARFAGEMAALQRIWHTDRIVDPFHHPALSRASEQFVVAL
jgi:O-antigen biosynthesis protein